MSVARVLVLLLLAMGAFYGWGNLKLYYLQAPGLVFLGTLIAIVMYAPTLWVLRRLDTRPVPWRYKACAFLFVAFFAAISSQWTADAIDAGVRYWQAVGPSEEFCKMSPLLVLLLFASGAIRGTRDGIVLGAIAGLSFAANEFATTFAIVNFPQQGFAALNTDIPARWALGTEMHILWGATTGGAIGYAVQSRPTPARWLVPFAIICVVIATHSLQDWLGKYLAPLSLALLDKPLALLGAAPEAVGPGTFAYAAMLVYSTTINTLLINVLVIPILWWEIRQSRSTEHAGYENDKGATPAF